jgi:Cu+-exporting ATPase
MADIAREESREVVQTLKARGKHVVMLTGDHRYTAEAIQKSLDIDELIAEVLPHEKEAVIRRLQSDGKKVAMVGDGINDAPALMRADIGIAIGSGTDIAVESADVVLLRHQLLDVVNVFDISRTVMKHIRQNLFWAFFYNIIGIPLAAGVFFSGLGWQLDPMFAAAAMSLSSVTVVLNALRINRFKAIESNTGNPTSIKLGDNQETIYNQLNTQNMSVKTMLVEGMTCGHCVMRVQKALNAIDGVEASVDLNSKTATLKISGAIDDQVLSNAVTDAGYEVKSIQ